MKRTPFLLAAIVVGIAVPASATKTFNIAPVEVCGWTDNSGIAPSSRGRVDNGSAAQQRLYCGITDFMGGGGAGGADDDYIVHYVDRNGASGAAASVYCELRSCDELHSTCVVSSIKYSCSSQPNFGCSSPETFSSSTVRTLLLEQPLRPLGSKTHAVCFLPAMSGANKSLLAGIDFSSTP